MLDINIQDQVYKYIGYIGIKYIGDIGIKYIGDIGIKYIGLGLSKLIN